MKGVGVQKQPKGKQKQESSKGKPESQVTLKRLRSSGQPVTPVKNLNSQIVRARERQENLILPRRQLKRKSIKHLNVVLSRVSKVLIIM